MKIVIVVFDSFTDLDVFLPWDLLNRTEVPKWEVRLIGEKATHRSLAGLDIPMHGTIEEANDANAVIFASGPATHEKCVDGMYLDQFKLTPDKQLIGSICSGALILAGLGLLKGREATTHPTARERLTRFGISVVEREFVRSGNIATAAKRLAGINLTAWIIEELGGKEIRDRVLSSVCPIGTSMGALGIAIEER